VPVAIIDINTRFSRALGTLPAIAFLGFDPQYARVPEEQFVGPINPDIFKDPTGIDKVLDLIDLQAKLRNSIAAKLVYNANRQDDPQPIRQFYIG
jgi:hypothetical protein